MLPKQSPPTPSPLHALAKLSLLLFHAIRSIVLALKCCIPRPHPKELNAPRRQLPKHIAICLETPSFISANTQSTKTTQTEEDCGLEDSIVEDMVECVRRAAEWCIKAEVETLSIFDRRGTHTWYHVAVRKLTCFPLRNLEIFPS